MHHRVQVADLAQAVAAELQRRGHEAQAPLADVERGPPVVVGAGVPVRHEHLRERHPVRDRPQPPAVTEPHLVQHQALTVVEPQPQPPVLPRKQPSLQREPDPGRLADLQRRHLPQRPPDQRGRVLAPHLGPVGRGALVLDLQQRHAVQVDHRVQPGHVVRVRIAVRAAPVPHVRPADPQAAVPFGHQRGAVGPHVGEHQGHVGDPAPGQRLGQRRVGPEHLVALVPLIDGHVRLLAGQVLPARHRVAGQGHHGPVGLPVRAVPAHHDRVPAGRRIRRQRGLARLPELDRREPPARADPALAPQDRGRLPDLLRRQRVERMCR